MLFKKKAKVQLEKFQIYTLVGFFGFIGEFVFCVVSFMGAAGRRQQQFLEFATAKFRGQRKSRIPKDKFGIPRDCFASLAMTKILEFSSFLQPLPRISKDSTNLEFLSLCHCEGAARPKQSL